jgi:NADH-quinone oxidoreductase subunit H
MTQILIILLKSLSFIVPILVAVAYFTLVERKIMASIQRRRGPNVIGYLGLLQPLADGLKLFVKEFTINSRIDGVLFYLAATLSLSVSLLGWALIPFGENLVLADVNLGLVFLMALSLMGVYCVILAGWSSNSKYSLLGSLRSGAQMVSYEVSLGFLVIPVVLCTGSFNLSEIVIAQESTWYFIALFPCFVLYFISALAETNRHPFDLAEAESELVAGYNVEYSGMGFALFFLAEYSNMLLMSSLISILFLGGWLPFLNFPPFSFMPGPFVLGIKVSFFVFLFCWVRAAFPRYRYDQLMSLSWKVFLPISLAFILFISSILLVFNWLPQ